MSQTLLFARNEPLPFLSLFLLTHSEYRYYAGNLIQPESIVFSTFANNCSETITTSLDDQIFATVRGKDFRAVVQYRVVNIQYLELISIKKTIQSKKIDDYRKVSILYKPLIRQKLQSPGDRGIWFRISEIKNVFDDQNVERIDYGIAGSRTYFRDLELDYPTNDTAYELGYSYSGELRYGKWVEQSYPSINNITVGPGKLYTIQFGKCPGSSRHSISLSGIKIRKGCLSATHRIDIADIEFTRETVIVFIDCKFVEYLFPGNIITGSAIASGTHQFLYDYSLAYYEKWGEGEPDISYLLKLYVPLLGGARNRLPLGATALKIIKK